MRKCKVIAVTNQKGGVGKTTTTANVAIGLERYGCKVLIVDFDPQGDLTTSLGWKSNDALECSVSNLLDAYINDKEINYSSLILKHKEDVDVIPANIELAPSVRCSFVMTIMILTWLYLSLMDCLAVKA